MSSKQASQSPIVRAQRASQKKKISSSLSTNAIAIISTLFTLSLFWRTFSQRPPLFGVPAPLASTDPTCTVYHNHTLSNCEDIRLFPDDSPWAILSCDKGRRLWSPAFGSMTPGAPEGELYLWNWRDQPESEPVLIPFRGAVGKDGYTTTGDFHPVGIAVYPLDSEKKQYRFFITNQAKKKALVEIVDFNLETSSYQHVQTINNPRIHSPNAIVALDATHFFVTSDLSFARTWSPGVVVEAALALPLAEVHYVALTEDPETHVRSARVQLATKMALPAGVEVDRESKKLWISSVTSGVWEYNFEVEDKKMKKLSKKEQEEEEKWKDPLFPLKFTPATFIRTPFWPDNLVLAEDKRLFVSGVFSVEEFFTSMISETARKPKTWTLELLPKLGKEELKSEEGKKELESRLVDPANVALRKEEARWRTVFWDDNTLYGGVSTGQLVNFRTGEKKEGYLGTSVVNNGVLLCRDHDATVGSKSWQYKPHQQPSEEVHKEL